MTTPAQDIQKILSGTYNPSYSQPAPTPMQQIQKIVGAKNYPVPSNPAPKSQPQQSSGGGGGGQSYQDQWNALGRSGQAPVGWHGESAPVEPQIDWNSLYQPAFDSLDEQQRLAQDDQAAQQAEAERSATSQTGKVDAESAAADTRFQTQTDRTAQKQQEDQSALQRSLLALRQRAGFMGQGSNLGQAVNQIGEQEYFKSLGANQKDYTNVFADINSQWNSFRQQASSAKKDIEDWLVNEKSSIVRETNKLIASINQSRAGLQQDKASHIAQVKSNAADLINQRNTMAMQAQTQMQQWLQQQQFLLTNKLTPIYNNYQAASVQTPTMSNFSPNAQQQASSPTIRWNPNTGKYEDPYGNVVS